MRTVLLPAAGRECLALLRIALGAEDWRIEVLAGGADPVRQLSIVRPDLVCIDLDQAGSESLLRAVGGTPSVVVAVTSEVGDEYAIGLLAMGADAVYTKPLAPDLLRARLDAAVRCVDKHGEPPSDTYSFEQLSVDLREPRVTVNNEPVHLSSTEMKLLTTMAINAGRIISQDQLLALVWGDGYESNYNLLRTFVSSIRRKLRAAGLSHDVIHTARQLGYWVPRAPALPLPAAAVRLPGEPLILQTRALRERLMAEGERLQGGMMELRRRTQDLTRSSAGEDAIRNTPESAQE